MSDLVGNPEDPFSHGAAQMKNVESLDKMHLNAGLLMLIKMLFALFRICF